MKRQPISPRWDLRIEREWPYRLITGAYIEPVKCRVALSAEFDREADALDFEQKVRELLSGN